MMARLISFERKLIVEAFELDVLRKRYYNTQLIKEKQDINKVHQLVRPLPFLPLMRMCEACVPFDWLD